MIPTSRPPSKSTVLVVPITRRHPQSIARTIPINRPPSKSNVRAIPINRQYPNPIVQTIPIDGPLLNQLYGRSQIDSIPNQLSG